ncbi:hypothetical protein GVX82_03010 [Patescibacteria group bacterium]|jgi:G3E family GTPase|nr:hypothetical protein [Patescibacteria group bacterium]
MRLTALVGTLGAGKSTVLKALTEEHARCGLKRDELAILVNEVGGMTEIDTPYARVITLPNGCFTCQDEQTLTNTLAVLDAQGVKLVLMEGFGVVSGEETRTFLAHSKYPFHIVGIVDAQNFRDNMVLYGELMGSHVRVANAGIVVTKLSGEFPEDVESFVAQYANARVPVFTLLEHEIYVPGKLLAALKRDGHHPQHHRGSCGHGHGHGHGHHVHDGHHHGDVHGWATYAMALKPDATLYDLMSILGRHVVSGLARAKGVVSGTSFNVAPGTSDWNIKTAPSGTIPFLILYIKAGTELDVASIASLVEEPVADTRKSHEVIRVDVAELDRLEALLKSGVEEIVTREPTVTSTGLLVTHPERLQLLKEASRRPQVKDKWFPQVMEACLRYWVKCSAVIAEGDLSDDGLNTSMRELGVSLAWWVEEFAEVLPNDLVEAVRRCQPARLVAQGLFELAALRTDPFWRYWQVKEYLRALDLEPDLPLVQEARAHLMGLVPEGERAQFG